MMSCILVSELLLAKLSVPLCRTLHSAGAISKQSQNIRRGAEHSLSTRTSVCESYLNSNALRFQLT